MPKPTDEELRNMPLPVPMGYKNTVRELLRSVRDDTWDAALEEAAQKVQAELDKLNGRWSLDSAYLHQAINAIRSLKEKP